MAKPSGDDRGRKGYPFPLGLKLALAMVLVILVKIVFLFAYLGPEVRESFIERSDSLTAMSREALDQMVRKSIVDSTDLLIQVNDFTTQWRRLQMKDLPLALYENDMDKVRKAVEKADARMSEGFREKVDILAGEMERRNLREVDRRLDALAREQIGQSADFAGEVQRNVLLLAGTVFIVLFLVLGCGLYQAVVNPLRRLRAGTRDVAGGRLDVDVGVRSRDEVGGLSRDFQAMVLKLRRSREELEELNRNLEGEVERKTAHLTKALDDLQSAQRKLIHAEKMASLGTLAGGVAHEFNNLMGGIRGCAGEALESETCEDGREALEVILRAAKRGGEITERLLRFAKQRDLKMETVDPARIMKEALELVEPDARKSGITIRERIGSTGLCIGDGDALHQVFLNLYTNAIQAMPNGGELLVKAERGEGETIISVKDTGEGIPPESIDRIFEPFYTTKDQHPDPKRRGSGLGLSVSYSIVEAHGGTLEAESEAGQGAVFRIRLPLQDA